MAIELLHIHHRLGRKTVNRSSQPHGVVGVLATLCMIAVAFQSITFVFTSGVTPASKVGGRQSSRIGFTSGNRHSLAARGGAEDDDDYEYIPSEIEIASLQPGQVLSGVVVNLAAFGAFVDVGATKPGLVPLGRMSEKTISSVSDMKLTIGDTVKVWVCDVKPAEQKFSLSMVGSKAPADLTPFQDFAATGEWIDGKVVTIKNFGIFVQVEARGGDIVASGLVPLREIKEGFVEDPEQEAKVGDQVKVRVIRVDLEKNQMSFSMKEPKAAEGPQDVTPFVGVEPDTWFDGVVQRLENFGAFVQVEKDDASVRGLVHITQIMDGFVEDVGEVLEINQKVRVRVLEVNQEKNQLRLSMKEPEKEITDPDKKKEPAEA